MRAIDIAIFLIIFEMVGSLIISMFMTDFDMINLMKMSFSSMNESEVNTLWQQTQTAANWILSAGFVVGTLISAVFGYYFFSAAFASAVIIINFVPHVKRFFSTFPLLLLSLGIPQPLTLLIVSIYNMVLVVSILFWLSGKGD